MTIPERISLPMMTAVYARMGFFPQPLDQLTFEREDGLMIFHAAYHQDEFCLTTVMEDIELTEKLGGIAEGLQDRFLDELVHLLEGDSCK